MKVATVLEPIEIQLLEAWTLCLPVVLAGEILGDPTQGLGMLNRGVYSSPDSYILPCLINR